MIHPPKPRTLLQLVLVAALLSVGVSSARAQTPACNALPPAGQAEARKAFGLVKVYEGCEGTIAACLEAKPRPSLVARLADDICRQVKAGRKTVDVVAAMELRATSMRPGGPTAKLELDPATLAGEPGAPVTVVLVACARCPFCRTTTLGLHREVTSGALRGKVKLYFRPFPLRNHEGSTEGGLALLAAARLGKFWPYALYLYGHFDEFQPARLGAWASAVGLDRAAFERTMGDPSIRDALVKSKKEGLRNKVTSTPTLFIDGRRYVYDLELPSIVDVLLEEHERLTRPSK